jgi:hypothetical protein
MGEYATFIRILCQWMLAGNLRVTQMQISNTSLYCKTVKFLHKIKVTVNR